jgi:hypothetical protein
MILDGDHHRQLIEQFQKVLEDEVTFLFFFLHFSSIDHMIELPNDAYVPWQIEHILSLIIQEHIHQMP